MRKLLKSKLFTLLLGSLVYCSYSYAELPKSNFKLPAKAPKSHVTLIYNKKFAKRFGFDPKKSRNLTKGLLAVRYSLYAATKQVDSEPYECYVDLFISSNMNVNYPEGDAPTGDFATFNKQTGFSMNGLTSISPADQKISREVDKAYNGLRFYLTAKALTPYEQAHYQDDPVLLDSYRRNLMPGISVLHFEPGCGYIAEIKQGAAVWLGKRNAKYTHKTKSGEYLYNMNSYNVLQLPISDDFKRYAKFGYCVIYNKIQDDLCDWSKKLCKEFKPKKSCFAFLPKTGN